MIVEGVFIDRATAAVFGPWLADVLRSEHNHGRRVDAVAVRVAEECNGVRRASDVAAGVSDVAGDVDGARGDRDSGRMLSTTSAAALCGKSPRTVRRWCESGRIGGMVGGTYEIDPDEFARFLNGNG